MSGRTGPAPSGSPRQEEMLRLLLGRQRLDRRLGREVGPLGDLGSGAGPPAPARAAPRPNRSAGQAVVKAGAERRLVERAGLGLRPSGRTSGRTSPSARPASAARPYRRPLAANSPGAMNIAGANPCSDPGRRLAEPRSELVRRQLAGLPGPACRTSVGQPRELLPSRASCPRPCPPARS